MKSININGWSFTLVNKNTKKGLMIIERFNNPEGYFLSDVYNNYSYYKEKALDEIKARFTGDRTDNNQDYYGYNPVITSHCVSNFTCALKCQINGVYYILYFTNVNNFAVCLD